MIRRLLYLAIVTTSITANAQHNYTIQEGQAPQADTSKSFTTTITGVQMDFVESEWRDFLHQYQGKSGEPIKNGDVVVMETEEVIFPILDNEKVDIMAMFRPFLNQNGLDSVMLTIWIEREDSTHLNPLVDEQAGQKVKDWLLSFYAQIDRTAITTD